MARFECTSRANPASHSQMTVLQASRLRFFHTCQAHTPTATVRTPPGTVPACYSVCHDSTARTRFQSLALQTPGPTHFSHQQFQAHVNYFYKSPSYLSFIILVGSRFQTSVELWIKFSTDSESSCCTQVRVVRVVTHMCNLRKFMCPASFILTKFHTRYWCE